MSRSEIICYSQIPRNLRAIEQTLRTGYTL